MNFVHILASYVSYLYLPAGVALSLFYTYPFFNILAGVLFLGDSFAAWTFPLLLLAFAGVMLIAVYTDAGDEKGDAAAANSKSSQQQPAACSSRPWEIAAGILLALLSAATETAIFLLAKTTRASPAATMLQLYPAALLPLAAWILLQGNQLGATLQQTALLVGFNLVVGFLGYFLRMFSIPLLPTAVFSVLTFVGVAAGYIWGLLFAKEIPTLGALTGSGLIALAVGLLKGFGK
jgi:drug/metabolite transporter (DMT)-like permease